MIIKLKHASIATPNVTFTFEINQIDPDATQTKYTYDTNLYSSVDEAVENNFEGYSEKMLSILIRHSKMELAQNRLV